MTDVRREIVNRWAELGLTEGLSGEIHEELTKLFESESKKLPVSHV